MSKLILIISLLCISFLNAQEQAWVQMSSLPPWAEERHHPITFSIEGTGYLLGGANATSTVMMKDFYRYNPKFDNWTQLEDYPGPGRGFGYGVVVDGKAYVGTGIIQDEAGNQAFGNDLWEFDPKTGEWTQLASLPQIEGRYHPAFVGVNGKIFVAAGAGIDNVTEQSSNLNDAWEYDIAKDEWRELPNMPGPERHHPYYFGIGTDFYVGCGHGSATQQSEITGQPVSIYNDFYKWDSENESWEVLNNFPGERRVAGTQFSYGGKGYFLSGEGEDHELLDEGEFWEYDPAFDEWTQLESHPGNSRWAPGNFVIDNKLYFTSGRSSYRSQAPKYEKDLWMYELPLISSVEEKEDVIVEIFPNPATKKINVKGNFKANFNIEIFNMKGVKVSEHSQVKEIDVNDLNSGMYFLKIITGEQEINKRFIKIGN